MPTDFVEALAYKKASGASTKTFEEWLAQLKAVYGLDQGLIQGYFGWIGNVLRGDFGDSWYYTVPVVEKFADVIWYSFALNVICFFLELITFSRDKVFNTLYKLLFVFS